MYFCALPVVARCAAYRVAVKSSLVEALCNPYADAPRRDLRFHLEDVLVAENNRVQVGPVGLGKHTTENETAATFTHHSARLWISDVGTPSFLATNEGELCSSTRS